MDLEQLYKENYRIVYGYLLSLSGDAGLAEELASETFLRGIQSLRSFKSGKISTWLCAIGRNLYLNERKRQKRHAPLDEALSMAAGSLEREFQDREQARQIFRLTRKLPEPQRSVFFMRINGMSFREIGDALGKKETWARVTYFRVRNGILTEMEDGI